MNSNDIIQFFRDKSVLVTGVTGFLGKVFVEKILRIQPNIKKLYLLVRAGDTNFATQRFFEEIAEKELFRILRERWDADLHSFISEKVVVVVGDVCQDNLGVRDPILREEMWRQLDIVLNLAATTNFDERYDVALNTNTMGAFNVLNFAKKCVNINMLLHVSTAYVCGRRSGIIKETSFPVGESIIGTCKLDIMTEKRLVTEKLYQLHANNASEKEITSTMKDLGITRAKLFGWQNIYTFTKAMGEMLLGYYKDNLSVLIIRPTAVIGTYKEPFPGWIEGLRTMDSLVIGHGKGKIKCLPANPDTLVDLIPVDMVVNAMIIAMVASANQRSSGQMIYHVGSSMTNPIKVSNLHQFSYIYFSKNPITNKSGKAINVKKVPIVDNFAKFRRYMTIRYVLPLKGLKLVNYIFCHHYKDIFSISERKIKSAMRLVELYEPYLFFNGIFDDTNTNKLRLAMKERKSEVDDEFNFDPTCIQWEHFILNTHIPGLVKFVLK